MEARWCVNSLRDNTVGENWPVDCQVNRINHYAIKPTQSDDDKHCT